MPAPTIAYEKTTTPTKFGGDALNNISKYLNGVDVTSVIGTPIIRTPTKFPSDKLIFTDPQEDNTVTVKIPSMSVNRNINLVPSNVINNDEVLYRTTVQEVEGKVISASSNTIQNLDTSNLASGSNILTTTNTKEMTNKTINTTTNNLTATSIVTGDLLRSDGSKFVRFPRGAANQVLTMNSGGTNFQWSDPPSTFSLFNTAVVFDVYKISSTYYITNKMTGSTTSGTDFSALMQAVWDAMVSPAYYIFNFDASNFLLENPLIVPLSDANNRKSIRFNGFYEYSRNFGSRLGPTSAFPTQRYYIEGKALDGSDQFPDFAINKFHLYNHPDYARHLNGNALNGGATVKDIGGILLEHSLYQRMSIPVSHISTTYMWRGLHLKGKLWYGTFHDIMFQDANANFSGNADLILENGSHTEDFGNPTVKECHFRNIKSFHSGEMDYGILMKSGNYNVFVDTFIEGNAYRKALIALDNSDYDINTGFICSANTFYRLSSIDTNTVPSPDNRIATLYLNGAGCVHNIVHDGMLTKYPNTIRIAGDAKNNVIYHAGYWGAVPTINDTGAGENNVIIIQGGWKTTNGLSKITTTAGIAKIQDMRKGATGDGIYTTSGNGTDKAFNIPHGCFTTPEVYDARPISVDSFGDYEITAGGTNITVTYQIAPRGGTDNLKWRWFAKVNA
jgi:hypothetical protein